MDSFRYGCHVSLRVYNFFWSRPRDFAESFALSAHFAAFGFSLRVQVLCIMGVFVLAQVYPEFLSAT
jgi:hypothetical protein